MQNYKLVVSNLPKNTNEEKLTSIFCEFDFIKIKVEKSQVKGECKGFGFIEFANEHEMKKALDMNGYMLEGKQLRVAREREDLCELNYLKRKEINTNQKEKEKVEQVQVKKTITVEKEFEIDENVQSTKYQKENVQFKLQELNKKMNENIFSKNQDEILVELSTLNPQLICELRHLFGDMDEKEFKQQIARNDELKKVYKNCCSSQHISIQEKICKINHLKFDVNPIKDEQLKKLCTILVKGFEGSKIDFNICTGLSSNITSLNIVPEQAIVFELTFGNKILGDQNFKELSMDKRKQKVIEMTLQKRISEILLVPFGEIVFVKIKEGSVKFDGIIPSNLLSRLTEKENDLHEFIYKTVKQKLIDGLENIYPLKNVEVALQTIKSKVSLNPNDFDARGDFYFSKKKGEKLVRGGNTYYQPSNKWKRFGLRVIGVYENDDWIKNDGNPNEWIVAFHGTRNSGERGLECIMKTRSSKGSTNVQEKDKIPKFGIYFAQNVEDCYKFPVELDGDRYEVAFQCRIHPDHFWSTGTRTFIVVDNPNYVRPYGIVLKKISKKK